MTDNEIIKALDEAEWFLRIRVMDGQSLTLNEYDIGILRDISQVCARAYDEINRQKAEIEKLELLNASLLESCEGYSKACDVYKAEIERLVEHTKEGIDLAKQLPEMLKLAQAEAIKYFAERVKAKFIPSLSFNEDLQKVVTVKDIDNLVKEMVGDDNEKV